MATDGREQRQKSDKKKNRICAQVPDFHHAAGGEVLAAFHFSDGLVEFRAVFFT
jgi:hypothetical protein